MIETKGVNDWLNWCNISWHFPPPFLSEQIGIHWCFAQRVTRGTETVRLNLPLRGYLFILSEEKQHNFFWHCRKNQKKNPVSAVLFSWEINCHHYAAGASVLQTSAVDGSCCQAFISVCLQNTVTASHTRVHFAELTASERFGQVRAAQKPRKLTLLWSLRHSRDLWSASVEGSEAHLWRQKVPKEH